MRMPIVEDQTEKAAYLRKGLIESGFSVDVAPREQAGLEWAARSRGPFQQE